MAKEKTPVEVSEKSLSNFEKVLGLISKYGIWNLFKGTVFFVFFSYMVYIAVNPGAMFERYDNYIREKHARSTEYRMETSPLVRNYLNQLSLEIGADRAYIIEYHNGKSNPTGLQWQFGEMTFLSDNAPDDIKGEYQEMSLAKYPIFYELNENMFWGGTITDLEEVDKRFALRAKINEAQYVSFAMLYGENLEEIGVLGISYTDSTKIAENMAIKKAMKKYSTAISPLLDERNAKRK